MRQWMLRITAYADRLLTGLDRIEWSDSLKEMQRNWIGRSEEPRSISKSTAFPRKSVSLPPAGHAVWRDLHGPGPEHSLVAKSPHRDQRAVVQNYRRQSPKKSDLERTDLAKDKLASATGGFAFNPANGQRIPIWNCRYVLAGSARATSWRCQARHARFGIRHPLWTPVVQVVEPPAGKDWHGYLEDGIAVNSRAPNSLWIGLPTPAAKKKITEWLEANQLGKSAVNYKLRDWLFSRQRYWASLPNRLEEGRGGTELSRSVAGIGASRRPSPTG